jgi:hypothetical protein
MEDMWGLKADLISKKSKDPKGQFPEKDEFRLHVISAYLF